MKLFKRKKTINSPSYSYVARQPIFDTNMKIYAYELLFRAGMTDLFPDIDGDTATSELISNTYLMSDIQKFSGGKKIFMNFTRNLLLKKIPLLFPEDSTVVEILENVGVEDSVLKACREIAQKGHLIALDDSIYNPTLEPFIALAHIIKFDFRQSTSAQIEHDIRRLDKYKVKILAEKVETYMEFKTALELGFHYFQGYFFAKPEIIKSKKLTTPKINLLRIISAINRSELDFDQLERLIARDVTVSFKLLRYVNSAYFRRAVEISSIKQAILFLGESEIKRFISLMAMAKLAEGKPDELIRLSAIRARFCELLGKYFGWSDSEGELFTMGLFSLIDAILDDSMENIMRKLPLSESIQDALVLERGKLIQYLRMVRSYEKGQWQSVSRCADILNIEEDRLPKLYLEALEWGQLLASL